jgi:predicted peroxiredoxin
MAEPASELVVVITHGADHELSSVAFTIANGGITSGLKVSIFLTSNGVDLVRKRAIDNLVVHPLEPLAALVKDCKGYIDRTSCADASADVVISNGVINLAPDKASVFREAARLLKPGGRLAIADIVTDAQLPETVTCNADLWAACIGGAMQRDDYRTAIEAAGLKVKALHENAGYLFISANARGAQQKWGVKSISLLAVKA